MSGQYRNHSKGINDIIQARKLFKNILNHVTTTTKKSPFCYPTQLVTPEANRYHKKIVFKLPVHTASYY